VTKRWRLEREFSTIAGIESISSMRHQRFILHSALVPSLRNRTGRLLRFALRRAILRFYGLPL
jgi:hypothetical protein